MKILELELLTDTITGTESFYREVLGLEPYMKEGKSVLFYQIGYTKLIFKKSENVKPVYHFAIDIPNNRFDEGHDFMKKKVDIIPVPGGSNIADFRNWHARSFYFYDNNGNILEFITRYDNNVLSSTAFSNESYISISEIGLVTQKVPEFADSITAKFGVPIFHRQPRAEQFTVLGNDEGLFILVENEREWYPVTIKAHSYHTRVLFMNSGVVHQFVM
ncbi:VOC family protein [Flavobacterium arcticum]|uniref:VOC family protein n=1 Tax=Flavobacterium arcticum TaxID=1784713 RepID=A0A345HEJ1_9FLAO|nr:VOC family protein [Flavobacterium arcticum]AXG75001.1 VOC family protein [Flavobacterium arcticum]KAF2506554.1 VOC family protein [Flavobacterium arcticum]